MMSVDHVCTLAPSIVALICLLLLTAHIAAERTTVSSTPLSQLAASSSTYTSVAPDINKPVVEFLYQPSPLLSSLTSSSSLSTSSSLSSVPLDDNAIIYGDFAHPYGVTVDASFIYVSDAYNRRVVIIDRISGARINITFTNPSLSVDFDVTVSFTTGLIYILDYNNARVITTNINGTILNLFNLTSLSPYPGAIALDSNNNIFITNGSQINKYNENGTILINSFNVDCISIEDIFIVAFYTDIYVACLRENLIKSFYSDGRAINNYTTENKPLSVYVSIYGYLYYSTEKIIYKYSLMERTIVEIFSLNNPPFSTWRGLAVDENNSVYVADYHGNRLVQFVKPLVISSSSSTASAASSSSSSSSSMFNPYITYTGFNGPFGVAVDSSFNIYVADTYNNMIQILYINTNTRKNLTFDNSPLHLPTDIILNNKGNMFILDDRNQRIIQSDTDGHILNIIISVQRNTSSIQHLALDSNENIYTVDSLHNRIIQFFNMNETNNNDNNINQQKEDYIIIDGCTIYCLAIDPNINWMYVSCLDRPMIKVINMQDYTKIIKNITTQAIPVALYVDEYGYIYYANQSAVFKYDLAQDMIIDVYMTNHTASMNLPHGIVVDGQRRVYVADSLGDRVVVFEPSIPYVSSSSSSSSSTGSSNFSLSSSSPANSPAYTSYITFDAITLADAVAVNSSHVYAVGKISSTVAVFNRVNGARSDITLESPYLLATPTALAVDLAGFIYIGDSYYNHALKIDAAGHVLAVYKTNVNVTAIAVNVSNNVYVVDGSDIIQFDSAGQILQTFSADCDRPTGIVTSSITQDNVHWTFICVACYSSNTINVFSIDNGLGPMYLFNLSAMNPLSISLDRYGAIYFSNDTAVYRIDPDFTHTVQVLLMMTSSISIDTAGGLAVDKSGNILVADYQNDRIVEFFNATVRTSSSSTGSPSLSSSSSSSSSLPSVEIPVIIYDGFHQPHGIAIDQSYQLYVADIENNVVVIIDPSTSTRTIITVNNELRQPSDVTVDSLNHIYISDTGNQRVIKCDDIGNILMEYKSSSLPTSLSQSESFYYFIAMVLDNSENNLYVLDAHNQEVIQFNITTGIELNKTIINSDCQAKDMAIGLTSNNIYIACKNYILILYQNQTQNNISVSVDIVSIFVMDEQNIFFTNFNTVFHYNVYYQAVIQTYTMMNSNKPLATEGGLALDMLGNIYVADTNNSRVVKFVTAPPLSSSSSSISSVSPSSYTSSSSYIYNPILIYKNFNAPAGIAVDLFSNIYVADTYNNAIQIIYTSTNTRKYITLNNPNLLLPTDITVDESGFIYIVDNGNHRIIKIDSDGHELILFDSSTLVTSNFTRVALDKNNNVYVMDITFQQIIKFAANGTLQAQFPINNCGLQDFTIDYLNNVYIICNNLDNNNIITIIDTNGNLRSNFSMHNNIILAVTINPIDYNGIYLYYSNQSAIYKYDWQHNLIVQTYLMTTDDNSLLLMNSSNGLAVDKNGNVYVADTNNNRIVVFLQSISSSSSAVSSSSSSSLSSSSTGTSNNNNDDTASTEFILLIVLIALVGVIALTIIIAAIAFYNRLASHGQTRKINKKVARSEPLLISAPLEDPTVHDDNS